MPRASTAWCIATDILAVVGTIVFIITVTVIIVTWGH